MIDRNSIRKLIEGHTPEFTIHHFYQELAETIVAVSKLEISLSEFKFDEGFKDALVGEMADNYISLEMMKEVYGITEERLELEIRNKMDKNLRRVENGEKE